MDLQRRRLAAATAATNGFAVSASVHPTLVRFEGCYDATSSPAPGPGPASASSAGASAPFSSSSPAAGHFAVVLRLISTISTELAARRWRPMRSQQPHAEVAALEILATARGSACLPHAWTRGRRLGCIPAHARGLPRGGLIFHFL